MGDSLSLRLDAMRHCIDDAPLDPALLLRELRAIAASFDIAVHELATLGLPDTLDRQLPNAAGELDAVVRHTEVATEVILDECEALEDLFDDPVVARSATRIYEACSFQDIVGQRVTKVLCVLHALEGKTAEIIRVLGPLPDVPVPAPAPLEGPARRLHATDQGRVDALMAEGVQ